jgi:hypothetical protein
MHAPNAPLAQLRSPLRRADSMANRSVGFGNGFQNAAANPFPPRKRKPAPLKALLRRGENTHTFDRENSDPTRDVGAVGIRENSDTPTNATTEGRPSAADDSDDARRERRWTLSVFERRGFATRFATRFATGFARVRRGGSRRTQTQSRERAHA